MPKSAAGPLTGIPTLAYVFKDPKFLEAALAHPSRRRGGAASPFERLEFLGDRVLGLVIANWLYDQFPTAREGELAKRHASLVNRDVCAAVARALELEKYLQVSKSERKDGFSETVLADATEALLAAIYLDGGLGAVEPVVKDLWQKYSDDNTYGHHAVADPKSALQELAQGRGWPLPEYVVMGQTGPAHNPEFVVQVRLPGQDPITAKGKNKRVAEKMAALHMYQQIKGPT